MYATDFEDAGMGPGAKECGLSLEAGKGKETDSPLKSPQVTGLQTHFRLLTSRSVKKINLYCFKPLNLW